MPLFKIKEDAPAPVTTAGCVPAEVIVRLPAALFVRLSPAFNVKNGTVPVCAVELVKAVCAFVSPAPPAMAKPATDANNAARREEKYI